MNRPKTKDLKVFIAVDENGLYSLGLDAEDAVNDLSVRRESGWARRVYELTLNVQLPCETIPVKVRIEAGDDGEAPPTIHGNGLDPSSELSARVYDMGEK